MNDKTDDLSELRAQLAPLSYAAIEALIGCADNIYDLTGYKDYLGEQWNAQSFEDEESKGYCWNLILFCAERIKAIQCVLGYGPIDIRQKVQIWP